MSEPNCPNCENYKRRMSMWREEAYWLAGTPITQRDYNSLNEADISNCVVHSDLNVYEGDLYKFVELLEKSFWEKNNA